MAQGKRLCSLPVRLHHHHQNQQILDYRLVCQYDQRQRKPKEKKLYIYSSEITSNTRKFKNSSSQGVENLPWLSFQQSPIFRLRLFVLPLNVQLAQTIEGKFMSDESRRKRALINLKTSSTNLDKPKTLALPSFKVTWKLNKFNRTKRLKNLTTGRKKCEHENFN